MNEVYGLSEYLVALHAAWLNESSTLFRRRYYENGSHAGFILYVTDPAQNQDDIDEMRAVLKSAKGRAISVTSFTTRPMARRTGSS